MGLMDQPLSESPVRFKMQQDVVFGEAASDSQNQFNVEKRSLNDTEWHMGQIQAKEVSVHHQSCCQLSQQNQIHQSEGTKLGSKIKVQHPPCFQNAYPAKYVRNIKATQVCFIEIL